MPTAAKIDKVSELTEKMGAAKALFVADFTGIDVATVSELRDELRQAEAEYQHGSVTIRNCRNSKDIVQRHGHIGDGDRHKRGKHRAPRRAGIALVQIIGGFHRMFGFLVHALADFDK